MKFVTKELKKQAKTFNKQNGEGARKQRASFLLERN